MAQSINHICEYTTKANSFHGGLGAKQGDVLIGDSGFEFFNHKNVADFVQIPWNAIVLVRAQVFRQGKMIRAFAIDTQSSGTFYFTAKDSGKILKAMRMHLSNEQLVRNLSLLQKLKRFFSSRLPNKT